MLKNFSYVIDGALAASARPGLWGNLMEDLTEAREGGITHIVCLTESPLIRAAVEEVGLQFLHLPVVDFTPPTIDQMREFAAYVDGVRANNGIVLVHCQAGMGRTGTMLASYFVSQGLSAEEAIDRVREMRTGSIETYDQEDAVREFERVLRGTPPDSQGGESG